MINRISACSDIDVSVARASDYLEQRILPRGRTRIIKRHQDSGNRLTFAEHAQMLFQENHPLMWRELHVWCYRCSKVGLDSIQ